MNIGTDRIVTTVELRAPLARVWRAVADAREFGAWFRVALEGPFAPGRPVRGRILHPGFEKVPFEAVVERMEPERLFSFRWHPYAVSEGVDYSKEPTTLVEFAFEKTAQGTRLTVTESGFDALPAHRRDQAFRMNEGGWVAQLENVARHVAQAP